MAGSTKQLLSQFKTTLKSAVNYASQQSFPFHSFLLLFWFCFNEIDGSPIILASFLLTFDISADFIFVQFFCTLFFHPFAVPFAVRHLRLCIFHFVAFTNFHFSLFRRSRPSLRRRIVVPLRYRRSLAVADMQSCLVPLNFNALAS